MKISVCTGSINRSAGGLFFSVRYLTKTLSENGLDCTVLSYDDGDVYSSDQSLWDFCRLRIVKYIGPKNFKFSFRHWLELNRSEPNIVHLHGLWMHQSTSTLKAAKNGIPVVVCPRGMLDQWAIKNNALVKKIVLFLFERSNINLASCFIALNSKEAQSIRSFGYKGDIYVIPNGVELRADDLNITRKLTKEENQDKPFICYIGRYDKKKGLLELIDAWLDENNKARLNGFKLILHGWGDESYIEEMKSRAHGCTLKSVEVNGSIYGGEKDLLLARAKGFILPSYSEGLPMAVLDAWRFGCVTMITPQCNLEESFYHDFSLKIQSPKKSDIIDTLNEFVLIPNSEVEQLGLLARLYVQDSFSWDIIAKKTEQVYSYLLEDNRKKPEFVYKG
ncbi:glycosyltransferase [Vibrio sp. F13]|uniref:glycosyltransferase n=1 Tax=Vibrio sp. F13 TaxID=2070777 RepID=UPI0010BD8410|nr:glycosyltransferase [Vibrio sp. F13]TKF73104.1 glycosyltransferase [Vibrio sp. F13]